MRHPFSLSIVACIAAAFLFPACRKDGNAGRSQPSLYASLPDLPFAADSEPLSGKEIHFIEVQLTEKGWRVHGAEPTRDEFAIMDRFAICKEEFEREGYNPYVLIEADAATPFRELREMMFMGVRAGLDKFLFAVRSGLRSPNSLAHLIPLTLPCGISCGSRPPVAPPLIHTARDGTICINTGPARETLDSGSARHELPELRKRLEIYVAAAEAADTEPIAGIQIDPETAYQRMIDVFSLLRSLGCNRVFLSMSNEESPFTGNPATLSLAGGT